MRQIRQNHRTGAVKLVEEPAPSCSSNSILVRNVTSLVSLITERSTIELGKKASWVRRRRGPIWLSFSPQNRDKKSRFLAIKN